MNCWESLEVLAGRLTALTAAGASSSWNTPVLHDADAIITHVEVNDSHGVGKFIRLLFLGEPKILSIRSANHYDGQHEFGDADIRISHENTSRDVVFSKVLEALGSHTVGRVLCVPYFPDDIRTALAIKEIFGVPVCTYLMDDQNISVKNIPDDLMREFLEKSTLRLAISPELCGAYERKYGRKIWYMPPLAPTSFMPSRLCPPPPDADPKHGVIIGNIWGKRWLDLLRQAVRGSAVSLTWYCSGGLDRLPCRKQELAADSIFAQEPLEESLLVRALRDKWFAVVPTGLLDEMDDRHFIAQYSLPSRIPYMIATSQIPILVLGSRDTGAAHFVEQNGVGIVARYDKESFVAAVDYITRPDVNTAMRKRALSLAGRFSDIGAAEWIWQSLALGRPIDQRYETLLDRSESDVASPSATNA